jgi:hypothetical protein
MAELTLAWPKETETTVRTLMQQTGAPDRARLIQDALRVYSWLVRHQQAGRTVIVLEPYDMAVLETTSLLDGERETLASLLAQPEGGDGARWLS